MLTSSGYTSKRRGLGVIAAALALCACAAAAGCSVEDVPTIPTYVHDVEPIVISRCIRCHGAGGKFNNDPDQTGSIPGAPYNGFFSVDGGGDLPCPDTDGGVDAGPLNCGRGLFFYATNPDAKALLVQKIHSSGNDRMPPPPSPALTSRQLQVFDAWLAESPPM